jgi:hypothetical protein
MKCAYWAIGNYPAFVFDKSEAAIMNNGQVALAFTSGYLFGRNHRTRWALALASAAAGRRLMSGHSPLGTNKLMSSEVGKLTDDFRSQLVSAGRSAAVAAVSQRMDALSDRLEERTAALRSPEAGEKTEKSKARDTEQAKAAEKTEQAEPTKKTRAEEVARPDEAAKRVKRAVGSRPKTPADRPAKPRKRADTGGAAQRRSHD